MRAERPDDVELNSAEMAGMESIAALLRADLDAAADRPAHFWKRQHERIRQRTTVRPASLRWPIAAMAALATLSFALLSISSSPPPVPVPVQATDYDDLLLQNIQHSLAHQAPETLMPASVLVQEMTTSSPEEQKRDN